MNVPPFIAAHQATGADPVAEVFSVCQFWYISTKEQLNHVSLAWVGSRWRQNIHTCLPNLLSSTFQQLKIQLKTKRTCKVQLNDPSPFSLISQVGSSFPRRFQHHEYRIKLIHEDSCKHILHYYEHFRKAVKHQSGNSRDFLWSVSQICHLQRAEGRGRAKPAPDRLYVVGSSPQLSA